MDRHLGWLYTSRAGPTGNDERGKRDTLMRDVELTEVEEDAMVMLKGIRTVTKHTRRINAWV